jgi:hypothetical protein
MHLWHRPGARHPQLTAIIAGFLCTASQPRTQPLYGCYSDAEHSHFASNRKGCEHMDKQEGLLGHDLKP